jgi:hypothetical protein
MRDYDELVEDRVLKDPTEDIGVEIDGEPPLSFCPLLFEDRAGDEWRIGCCSLPECTQCPHLTLRLDHPSTWPKKGSLAKLRKLRPHDYHVRWVCSDCTHELEPVLYPGFYSDGYCDRCGKESIVLQVVLVPRLAPLVR